MRALPLLLLVACVEYGVNGKTAPPAGEAEEGAPAIRVEPAALAFGDVPVGGASAPATVTVHNDGDAPLGLEPVVLAEPSAPFTLTSLESTLLPPGGSTTFTVTFLPDVSGAFATDALVRSDDADTPELPVALTGGGVAGDLTVEPALHDFGTLDCQATDAVDVTIRNDGVAAVRVAELTYTTAGTELSLDAREADNGALPWVLAPGEQRVVTVNYAPTDDVADEGYVTVVSDDPDEGTLFANQIGNARAWEGFSTGWYIVDDGTNYETTSNPSYTVEYHGDRDGYWYEPSGARGLIGSADPAGDFAILRDYIIARAGAPTPVTGPLTFRTSSTVPSLTYASYSYVLCDFWIDTGDDPNLYEVSTGAVDDGVLVLLNGEIVGDVILGGTGRWTLSMARPGEVNSLVVILMDNAAVDKYLLDLAFLRDGVIVSG
jgi:hypothetical protein